jgi:mannose-6-phosphate isomerase-like protein (cupin superfamily)
MTDPLEGYVAGPAAGVSPDDPSLKASSRSTGGALSVFETSVGTGPPLHVHDHEDESLYVLTGELSVRCGDATFNAPAGSFVFLPRGRAHRFSSTGGPVRLLLIAVPGGIEAYFREISAAVGDTEVHRVGERYGIRVVPDPSASQP